MEAEILLHCMIQTQGLSYLQQVQNGKSKACLQFFFHFIALKSREYEMKLSVK